MSISITKIAKLLTNLFNPFLLFAPVQVVYYLLLGIHSIDFPALIATILLQSVLPLGLVIIFIKLGLINDIEITDKNQRTVYFSLVAIMFAATTYISAANIQICLINLALTISLGCIILINVKWKISGHLVFDAILFAGLMRIDTRFWPLLLALPVIAWTRILLKKHTFSQTVAGVLLGCAVYEGLLLFIR